MKTWFKRALILFLVLSALFFMFGYQTYLKLYSANVPYQLKDKFVHIPSNSTYNDLLRILKQGGYINNASSFDWVANMMKFKQGKIRAGRYELSGGMGNRELIKMLRSGKQSPVRLVLVNERLTTDVAGKVSRFLEADSLSVLSLLENKDFLEKKDIKAEDLMSVFIPNTYEFFWNTSAEQFFERMLKERDRFWSEKRSEQASKLNMTKEEVYTLASIVERETNDNSEKKRIAGVYLNRLRIKQPLQADPTVVFAVGDFGLKRILKSHLEMDSPYNTYKYAGLPPGPISMASISSLDAVLNAEQHDYLYFCAKPDGSGSHAFAETYQGHLVNAKRYHEYLRTLGREPNDK